MSTKTITKRIALVAASALALGGFSVISAPQASAGINVTANLPFYASVYATTSDNNGTDSTTAAVVEVSQVAGSDNFVTLTAGVDSAGEAAKVTVSGANAWITATASGGAATWTDNTTTANNKATELVSSSNDLFNSTGHSIKVRTPEAGTAVVKVYSRVTAAGAVTDTLRQTFTISVTTAAAGTTYTQSTANMVNTTVSANTAPTAANEIAAIAAGNLKAAATASDAGVARIDVAQYASADTSTAITNGYAKAVTVAATNAGLIGASAATRGPSASVAALGDGTDTFYLFADGRSGTSTITITVNGVVVATKSFLFTGTTVATYGVTAGGNAIVAKGAASTYTITGKDSNNNTVAAGPGTIYVKSANTAIATVSVSGATVSVTGVASGSTSYDICNTAGCVDATKKLTVPVKVSGTTPGKVSITFDKASYAPGEKMVISINVLDTAGAAIADGTYSVVKTALVSNVSLVAAPATLTASTWSDAASITTSAISDGSISYVAYAPLVAGTVTVSTTEGDGTFGYISTAERAVITASVDVEGDATASLALDAANAATDAANNAYDEAQNATQAASDALAAVTALAAQVKSLIASVKKLTAAVAKLKK
jgi:hypothetical protein